MAHAVRADWVSLERTSEAPLALPDVTIVARELWDDLRQNCNLNSVKLDVSYDYSKFREPEYAGVLAYASRTMWLINDEWVSTALTGYDDLNGFIWIRVNPYVPNGWYLDDGSCNIGNHFDLKSVLRHELLHGVGLSSSIREHDLGYFHNLVCYPLQFDTRIETVEGQKLVQGCNLTTSSVGDLFLNGVQLYNPETFVPGSSFSHSTRGIMNAYIPARQCMYLDQDAGDMLEGLGVHCKQTYLNSATNGAENYSISYILVILIVFIILKN